MFVMATPGCATEVEGEGLEVATLMDDALEGMADEDAAAGTGNATLEDGQILTVLHLVTV